MRTDREIYLLADKNYSLLTMPEVKRLDYINSLPFRDKMGLVSINNSANIYGNKIRGFDLIEKAHGGKACRGRPAQSSAEKK